MILKIQWKALFLSLLIGMGVGGLSAWITSGGMPLYEELAKPPLSPPGWLFGVVWTVLFFLMGISSYIVYTSDSPKKGTALKFAAVLAGFFLAYIAVDIDNRDDRAFFKSGEVGGLSSGSLSFVGYFCRVSLFFRGSVELKFSLV